MLRTTPYEVRLEMSWKKKERSETRVMNQQGAGEQDGNHGIMIMNDFWCTDGVKMAFVVR